MDLINNFSEILRKIYGNNQTVQKAKLFRYNNLMNRFSEHFTDNEVFLFSTPGRTEIGGNHTDHNLGRVIAASVNLDTIAITSKNENKNVTLYSDGYDKPFEINLNSLDKRNEEEGTTNSLIRGIASRFIQLGYNIGGFNGVMTSDVLPGSGLSSSASVEVMICNIFNSLYNDDKVPKEELAKIGQWAENNYFGKPCGLMDQLACAFGGIISIDFINPEKPEIKKVNFDFESQGYKLLIVDTGGNHEDLTDDYAAIPKEMKLVAKLFGKEVCREIEENEFLNNIKEIRDKVGDRATLRAYHFFQENKRVIKQVNSLEKNQFGQFLNLITESGNSSFKLLQNIYSAKNFEEQSVSLGLAFTEQFIHEKGKGAVRVHGGGFAGTIQVFLPDEYVEAYKKFTELIIGKSSIMTLDIRSLGTVCLNLL